MPGFSYKARDNNGRMVEGILFAEGEEELFPSLKEKKLYLISYSEIKGDKGASIWKKRVLEKVTRRDLIDFTSNLATILASGIPILSGLMDLEKITKKTELKETIEKIRKDVESGLVLSEAMEKHPRVFLSTYVNAVRAGEGSGNMDEVLRELVAFLEWQQDIEENIRKVMSYPVLILSVISFLVFIMVGFVFPKLIPVFTSLNIPLPLPTRVLMSIREIVISGWPVIILGLGILVVMYRYLKKIAKGRLLIDGLWLKMPIWGELIQKISISRFIHNLNTLLKAGVDIGRSLGIAGGAAGNRVIVRAINEAREEVMKGESLAASLDKSGKLPPLVVRMFYVGERSGRMEESLDNMISYYDKNIPETIGKIARTLEPLTIIILGFIVLAMALTLVVPMYKMIGAVR